MVDEILNAEAYTNDEDIQDFGATAKPLSCAFCGGEVFLKLFSCKNTCVRNSTVDPTPANIISICPSCYVDGRTCLCGDMTPFRLQPITPMVTLRDEVATWLRRRSKDVLLEDSEDDATIDDPQNTAEQEQSVLPSSLCL